MNGMPWFRMYVDFLEDPKILSLDFGDQRHFIGLLALKCSGVIDQECPEAMMNKIVAQRLWIDQSAVIEVKRRLIEAGLIDKNWQPLAWERRQRRSDHDPSGAERQKRYRERKKQPEDSDDDSNALRNADSNAAVTPPDKIRVDTEEDTDKEIETNVSMPDFAAQSADPPAAESKNGKVPWDKDTYIGKASRVLDLLNRKLGTKYPATTGNNKPSASAKLIMARLKDGYGADDFKAVIADRLHAWQTDDKMREFLRPQTLFKAQNFESYLGLAQRKDRR